MSSSLHLSPINLSEPNDHANIDTYRSDNNNKRVSDISSIQQPSHTWWDESQLDLDLAEDPVLITPTNKKQKLKQKIMVTMRHHHHHDHQRTSWVSSSSTNSSLYSAHSSSMPSFHHHLHLSSSSSSSTRSKISRSFLQLKQLIIKKH